MSFSYGQALDRLENGGGGGDMSLPSDPYSAPGRLVFNVSDPWEVDWVPFNPSFPPPVNWLQVAKDAILGTDSATVPPIAQNGVDSPSKVFKIPGQGLRRHPRLSKPHLHRQPVDQIRAASVAAAQKPSQQDLIGPFGRKTILVLGDSVDRGNIKYMSENLGLPLKIAQWEDANDLDHLKYLDNGANPSYLPHQLWLPQPIDALITNCFLYGLVGLERVDGLFKILPVLTGLSLSRTTSGTFWTATLIPRSVGVTPRLWSCLTG